MKAPIDNFVCLDYPKGNITQWFGENPTLYQRAFGVNGHNGIDIVAPWGTPIKAVEGGRVVEVKNTPEGFGKHVRILCDHSQIEWTYGHLSTIIVRVGQEVKEGEVIGNMGNTGFVVSGATPFWEYNPFAGTHLHLGARKFKYDTKGWAYYQGQFPISIPDYENGFKGAYDFRPLLESVSETPVEDREKKITLLKQAIGLAQQILAILKR